MLEHTPLPEQAGQGAILALLRALQFGDSMLPVGAFSFSNGLESAVAAGLVKDERTLHEYVEALAEQAAHGDSIALLHAHRAAVRGDLVGVIAADHAVYNRKLNEEARTMTVRMGRKLGELGEYVTKDALLREWLAAGKRGATPSAYPIALAILCAGLYLDEQIAFAVHQYGVATMVLGAATRLMKVNYLATQAILFAVNGNVVAAYQRVATAQLDDMAQFAPQADILAAIHMQAHVRMFMS